MPRSLQVALRTIVAPDYLWQTPIYPVANADLPCGKRRFTLWQTKAYHAPRLSVEAAARLMGVGRRQVYRLRPLPLMVRWPWFRASVVARAITAATGSTTATAKKA
jgi:hypothetical protein